MKKTIRLNLLIAVLLGVSFSSCKKYLDINTSPVTSTSVDPKLLFGYAVTAWDVNRTSGDNYIPVALFSQTIASGGNYGWGAENLYDLSPVLIGNTWKGYYNNGGNNLLLAIKFAEEKGDKNTVAQCKTVLAQMMYDATVLFGDIPFSEAWKADIPFPKFDSQKDVFEGILNWLNDALATFDPANPQKISTYDIYYGGDINKWKKLATSLKFKVLMTMVDKDPSKAAEIGTLLQNPAAMIASPAENWLHKYSTVANNENPKYRLSARYGGGQQIFFFANNTVLDLMKPTNDPRIPKYFEKGPAASDYFGVNTEEEATASTAIISNWLFRKDAPDVLLTYQEVLLMQAEAYTRGIGVAVNLAKANDLFKDGVREAMLFYQANAADVTSYINTQLPNLTTVANPLLEIRKQQWIDFMDRPIDAFTLWRRSGPEGSEFPNLTLPTGATSGPLIRRLPYWVDELNNNINAPNPAPNYYTKMWFDL